MGLISNFEFASSLERACAGFEIAELQVRANRALKNSMPFLKQICNPRGRADRKGFLFVAVTFLILQLMTAGVFWLFQIEASQTLTVLLNAPVFWIGTAMCFKRLHDVGVSGWWLPGAFGMWFAAAIVATTIISLIAGEQALEAGSIGYVAVFALVTLPAFGALLWLHTAPSDKNPNRYGPVTSDNGLSMPSSAAA